MKKLKCIATLLEKNAVRKLNWDEASKNLGHYSQIFTVPKPNGKHRVVINMKPLNEQVKKEKFRMETIKDVKSLIQPNDYGAVVDLTDAYYTVSLHKDSRKYCRFILVHRFKAQKKRSKNCSLFGRFTGFSIVYGVL